MLTRTLLRQSGFTLMELTVVLVIVALLLGGLLVPFGTQRDIELMRATEKSLIDIREALIGFAAINGRLPCPAQGTIASGVANAGIEATTGSGASLTCACAAASSPGVATIGATACATALSTDSVGGVLPWATLGLLETDAWRYRYTYHVSSFFARGIDSAQILFGASCTPTTTPTYAAFGLCTPGAITINTAASGGTVLASSVPAVVVSHGGSPLGAYTTSGTKLDSAAAGADEAANVDGNATFVSNTTLDDRLIWIPATQLMNRMITAGKLP
ncbi:MAG: prepilin-type N-terminal cleavage/methylation domain-containing protein [Rhodocyclaceae bacterium]|nr:MAG: prepilin-type N-terminal cleavage/methylation domain-containing protein [Rhodocyclaceae bacterium]